MCKGFLDKDRSPGDPVHKAFCLSALALHGFHVFHLVVRFCSLKIEAFSTSERGLQYFHTRFPLLPSHILLIPCLSLSLPSSWGAGVGERHSWVPDAKCFSQGCSPSWTCYWLALPKSNGIADRCCKTPPTCSGSKFSYNVCAWAGTRGFLMCSPILITAVASQARGMASFIANSCFLSSNCVCGSVQPQRGFWQLAGAAAFPLLSCDN